MHDRLGDAQPDDASDRRGVAQRGQHLGPHADHLFRIAEHLPATRGGRDVACFTRQELEAEFVFELRDPVRNRRLGGVELLRSAAKAAKRHDPDEGFQPLEINHPASALRLAQSSLQWSSPIRERKQSIMRADVGR